MLQSSEYIYVSKCEQCDPFVNVIGAILNNSESSTIERKTDPSNVFDIELDDRKIPVNISDSFMIEQKSDRPISLCRILWTKNSQNSTGLTKKCEYKPNEHVELQSRSRSITKATRPIGFETDF